MLVKIVFAVSVLILVLICVWIGYYIFKWPDPMPLCISRWHRAMVLLGCIAIASITSIKYDWPVYYFPGLSGRVVDMDTGEPMKDAVVRVEVMVLRNGTPAGLARGYQFIESVVTGADGKYRITPRLTVTFGDFTKLDIVDVTAMHILTAQTHKKIPAVRLAPRTEDIKLMNVGKALMVLKAQKRLPDGVDTIWKEEFEFVARELRQASIPIETIMRYYSEYCAARMTVFGSNNAGTKELCINWTPVK